MQWYDRRETPPQSLLTQGGTFHGVYEQALRGDWREAPVSWSGRPQSPPDRRGSLHRDNWRGAEQRGYRGAWDGDHGSHRS